jgi:hypothetical integral membrane protein (TIGR02206 family)
MNYFLDTVETTPPNVGFDLFGSLHICWLVAFLVTVLANCFWYRNLSTKGRDRWRKIVAILIVLDELYKTIFLLIGKRYMLSYLPLHLCSINIFVIALYAWKPSQSIGAFLYTICIPGAVAALLFPSWTSLPLANFMHWHSFTIHILLATYPLVLAVNGELELSLKDIPKCLLLLIVMAIPIYGINILLDTNFMFLMYVEDGNPLLIFENLWGNHLYGFPVIIAGVLVVMFLPVLIINKIKEKKNPPV